MRSSRPPLPCSLFRAADEQTYPGVRLRRKAFVLFVQQQSQWRLNSEMSVRLRRAKTLSKTPSTGRYSLKRSNIKRAWSMALRKLSRSGKKAGLQASRGTRKTAACVRMPKERRSTRTTHSSQQRRYQSRTNGTSRRFPTNTRGARRNPDTPKKQSESSVFCCQLRIWDSMPIAGLAATHTVHFVNCKYCK